MSVEKIAEELATMAINLGLNIEQITECLKEAAGEQDGKPYAVDEDYDDDGGFVESKGEEDVPSVTLQQGDVNLLGFDYEGDSNNIQPLDDTGFFGFGKTAFGRKILSKATESVRQIGKKKGIYIVGRKGKKFLGIRFTPKGNYSKNKKGRPNGKMYTLDGLRKMKNKRVSFKKLPQLIDMMDTGAVLKKHKDFKFGFELRKSRCSGFGYTFPVGAGYGRRSALLYGKL